MIRAKENHRNPKGFAGLLMIVIAALILLAGFFIWQKYSSKGMKNVIGNQVDKDGNIIPAPEINSPQDQVDAVRDMTKNLEDKRNQEIQNELDRIK